eukprot:jgi/Mesvir1/19054/Mv12816-RA.1
MGSLKPCSLIRGAVDFQGVPSPASISSCRVAVQVLDGVSPVRAFAANGSHVYSVSIPLADPGASECSVSMGKEGLILPAHLPGTRTQRMDEILHRSEVQGVAADSRAGRVSVASVDSFGNLSVACLQSSQRDHLDEVGLVHSYHASAVDNACNEPGWAGVAFSPRQPSTIATAQYFGRSLAVYDQDMLVRSFHTHAHPTALTFLGAGAADNDATVVLTESSLLSIWDCRAGERGGCVQRLINAWGGGSLYCISPMPCGGGGDAGLVAVAGTERCVTVYDTRRWGIVGTWSHATKYQITSLQMSSLSPDMCYVGGLDNEVVCGHWNHDASKSAKKASGATAADGEGIRDSDPDGFSFRGDGNWQGLALVSVAGC